MAFCRVLGPWCWWCQGREFYGHCCPSHIQTKCWSMKRRTCGVVPTVPNTRISTVAGREWGKAPQIRAGTLMQEGKTGAGDTWAWLRSSQIKSSLPSTLRATTAWEGTRARWHPLYSCTGLRVFSLQSSSYWSLSAWLARFSRGGKPTWADSQQTMSRGAQPSQIVCLGICWNSFPSPRWSHSDLLPCLWSVSVMPHHHGKLDNSLCL